MDNLEIEEAQGQSGAHIWKLKGALTLKVLFDFQDRIRKHKSENWILDLGGISYMDSAALGAILGAYASCERGKRGFALANVSPRVLTMFEVAGVDNMVPRFDTVEAAEKHLASKG